MEGGNTGRNAKLKQLQKRSFSRSARTINTQFHEQAAAAAAAAAAGDLDHWRRTTDPKTGREYFYNKVTKETSWVPPTVLPKSLDTNDAVQYRNHFRGKSEMPSGGLKLGFAASETRLGPSYGSDSRKGFAESYKHGYLLKLTKGLAGRKSWKKKWFVLRGPVLNIYQSPPLSAKDKPQSILILSKATISGSEEGNGGERLLLLQIKDEKMATISLKASSSKDAQNWITALQEASLHYKQENAAIIDEDTRDALGDFISKSVSAMVEMQHEHHESLKSDAYMEQVEIPNGVKERSLVDIAPKVFSKIRYMDGMSNATYAESIAKGFKGKATVGEGKSGQLFLLTKDGQIILKTLKQSELPFLLSILPNYVSHLETEPETLLVKFYGVYTVTLGKFKRHLIAMPNVLKSDLSIDEVYDLKGSTRNREVTQEEIDAGVSTLKDLNFDNRCRELGEGIMLDDAMTKKFLCQLDADLILLRRLDIMDYSLLLGIHRSTPNDGDTRVASKSRVVSNIWQRHRGGVRGVNGDIYFLSVIDILQKFDFSKKMENKMKSATRDQYLISAVDPALYALRCVNYLAAAIGPQLQVNDSKITRTVLFAIQMAAIQSGISDQMRHPHPVHHRLLLQMHYGHRATFKNAELYEIIDFAPTVFRSLRHAMGVSDHAFSSALNTGLVGAETATSGQSLNLRTSDGQFCFTSIKKEEVETLMHMLERYTAYMTKNRGTLLPKIVAMLELNVKNFQAKTYVIVTVNTLRTKVSRIYQLKGVMLHRFTKRVDATSELALKDKNFIEDNVSSLDFGSQSSSFLRQLHDDTEFLKTCSHVGYTLNIAYSRTHGEHCWTLADGLYVYVYMGNTLRSYSMKKQMEGKFKGLKHGGGHSASATPNSYRDRLLQFVNEHVLPTS